MHQLPEWLILWKGHQWIHLRASATHTTSLYMMLKETSWCSRTTSHSTLLLWWETKALDGLLPLKIRVWQVTLLRLTLFPADPRGDYCAGKPWFHWINVREYSLPLASARGKQAFKYCLASFLSEGTNPRLTDLLEKRNQKRIFSLPSELPRQMWSPDGMDEWQKPFSVDTGSS